MVEGFELTVAMLSGWQSTRPPAWWPPGECGKCLNQWKPELAENPVKQPPLGVRYIIDKLERPLQLD